MSVTIDLSEHAAIVTLRWPERRNALGPQEADEVADAIDTAAGSGAAALVLTGEQAFCAGGDLPSILSAIDGATPADVESIVYEHFQKLARALRGCRIPTVAAVNGAAIGLGLDLALWCDRRFVARSARLGQGWARMGLIPGTGGAALLERLAPGLLWKLLGTDGELTVEEAATHGIAEVVEDPVGTAIEFATALSRAGTAALAGYVQLARTGLPDEAYLRDCARLQSHRLTSADFARRVERSGLSAKKA
ncbi:enoyl-CoA hydratase/isomerase family protein [Nocardia miyunensis]|uniref:enoyl-CoA hydratase/isomerase family protein n=1 Tax=Nocardia miyunensis TaxID=282684 RepID=UPI00082C8D02|nr:enoyl-CoA hydratase/isomerase family protein [Nocardia miyunensis]